MPIPGNVILVFYLIPGISLPISPGPREFHSTFHSDQEIEPHIPVLESDNQHPSIGEGVTEDFVKF